MSVKIIDSFQNTVSNLDSDECAAGTSDIDITRAHTDHPSADQQTARHIPYIHDAATDLRKRRWMH